MPFEEIEQEINQDITEPVVWSLSTAMIDTFTDWLITNQDKGFSGRDIACAATFAAAGLIFASMAPYETSADLVHELLSEMETLIVERLERYQP